VSAAELHHRLRLLGLELHDARHSGLIDCQQYRRDHEEELAECRVAYGGLPSRRSPTLRAELSSRQVG
jgi:hypothetical protein